MAIPGKIPPANLYPNIGKISPNQQAEKPSQAVTNRVEKGDRVQLSQAAKEIQMARNILKTLPSVREEKVAAIKTQLEEGTYRMDTEKIAGAMLRESLENEQF